MNRDERVRETMLFMSSQFVEGVSSKPIQEKLWPHMIQLTNAADVHRTFGYSSAQFFAYDDKWAFFYCPEVIADTTADLSDDDFYAWLRYIRAHTSCHASLRTQDEGAVDLAVFSVMPEARDLVARVHDHIFFF